MTLVEALVEAAVRAMRPMHLAQAFAVEAPSLHGLELVPGFVGDTLVVPQADGGTRTFRRGHAYARVNVAGIDARDIHALLCKAAQALGRSIERAMAGEYEPRGFSDIPWPDGGMFDTGSSNFFAQPGRACKFHYLGKGVPHIVDDDGMMLRTGGDEVRLRVFGQIVSYGPAAPVKRKGFIFNWTTPAPAIPAAAPAPRPCSCDMTTLLRAGCKCGGR
jgi:hypothetical protein